MNYGCLFQIKEAQNIMQLNVATRYIFKTSMWVQTLYINGKHWNKTEKILHDLFDTYRFNVWGNLKLLLKYFVKMFTLFCIQTLEQDLKIFLNYLLWALTSWWACWLQHIQNVPDFLVKNVNCLNDIPSEKVEIKQAEGCCVWQSVAGLISQGRVQ